MAQTDHVSPTPDELRRCELLAELPPETLEALAARMSVEYVPAGPPKVIKGEGAARFYVVLTGMLAVDDESAGPEALLRPGGYFGEIGLLLNVPRTASVRALSPATVASCDRSAFDELLRLLFEQGRGREIVEKRLGSKPSGPPP